MGRRQRWWAGLGLRLAAKPLPGEDRTAAAPWPPPLEAHGARTCSLGVMQAHLDSSSLQELVSTGLSVFTMHVMADTTPAASSFLTRARTKLGLSWGRRWLSSLNREQGPSHSTTRCAGQQREGSPLKSKTCLPWTPQINGPH